MLGRWRIIDGVLIDNGWSDHGCTLMSGRVALLSTNPCGFDLGLMDLDRHLCTGNLSRAPVYAAFLQSAVRSKLCPESTAVLAHRLMAIVDWLERVDNRHLG